MANPAVSIIMTVYNGEQYLEQTIESIRCQTLTHFECVIVDDGSQDRTPELLARETQNDPRFKVIYSKHLGRAKALNLAWKTAYGQWIANLDADDSCEPKRLEEQLNFLQQHPDIGLVGTAWNYVDPQGKYLSSEHPPLDNQVLRKGLIRHIQFCHSSVMMPRFALENIGGYNEQIQVAIDYDLCVRIARSYPVANLPQILTTKRLRPVTFFSRIKVWQRYRTVVAIRWKAWQSFSGSLIDLLYVLNPIGILDQGARKKLRIVYDRFRNRSMIVDKDRQTNS